MVSESIPVLSRVSSNFLRSAGSSMMMFETCMPARLKVLLGAVQVTVRREISCEREAVGICR